MTYRPYLNPDRSRHQLDPHGDETPPLTARRPLSPMGQTLVDYAVGAVQRATPALAAMVAGFQARPAGSEENTR